MFFIYMHQVECRMLSMALHRLDKVHVSAVSLEMQKEGQLLLTCRSQYIAGGVHSLSFITGFTGPLIVARIVAIKIDCGQIVAIKI